MTDRELDALVAEKVMGWCWQTYSGYRWFAPESDLGVRKRWCNSQLVDIEIRRADRPADEYETEGPWWLEGETRTSGPAFKEHVEMRHVVPHFSTSIADALLVVEEMRKKHKAWPIEIEVDRYSGIYSGGEWNVAFNCTLSGARGGDPTAVAYWVDPPAGAAADNSLPRAICLAALRALGVEVQP